MKKYENLFSFKEKVAVVTGAAGILGKEFCHALCNLGASVACLDKDDKLLNELVNELSDAFGKDNVAGYICNVSDQNEINEIVDQIINRFKKIDILLNNAATKTEDLKAFFANFTEYSLHVWREVMSVNLDAMFIVAQSIGKHMLLNKHGSIVQTASIYSLLAPDQRIYAGSNYLGNEINTPAVYTTSKAGVIGLTKHLAAIWGEHGVRVNALCPGGVESGQNETFQKKYSARIPMGRMAEKIDIVGPMLFLASDASRYMTGQVIYVDGGLSVW